MSNESQLIVVPTYNEKQNIIPLVKGIFEHAPSADILFVDDNSEDGTADVINTLKAEHPDRINLLMRSKKLGLGSAYIAGFNWGLQRNYAVLIEMDADLSHNPFYLKNFFQKLKDHDIVIGSRYVKGGGTRNWSLLRRIISRFGSLYARIILNVNIADFTGGFNAWNSNVLKAIKIDEVSSDGYVFQIELKFRAILAGFKWTEIPIIFCDRIEGQSKMSTSVIVEAVLRVIALRLFKHKFLKGRNIHIEQELNTNQGN